MGVTLDRADAIAAALGAAGVRATTDPGAVTPPCVLILPPDVRYDLSCGFTAIWTLVALAPGAQGADHTTWGLLEELLDGTVTALDTITDANLVAYTLGGVAYPSYLIRTEETL